MQQTHNPEINYTAEDLKVFDELSTVRMYQQDMREFGFVRPETKQQVYNEELSFVAEGINAPLKTDFTLKKTAEGLVDERGNLLSDALDRGIIAASNAARADSRLGFNYRRAILEREEAREVEGMMESDDANTIVTVSPFAHEAHDQYGDELVELIGMNPDRKLAFIRIYQKVSAQQLRMISVSVDTSDLDSFRGMMGELGVVIPIGVRSDDFISHRYKGELDEVSQEILPDQLRYIYDQKLKEKYNQEFNAGRPDKDSVDAWRFIEAQKDLVAHYFENLEKLAQANPTSREKIKLTVSFWSALKRRMEQGGNLYQQKDIGGSEIHNMLLEQELALGWSAAVAKHERMLACGGGFGASENILDNSPANIFATIFGNESTEALKSWDWKPGLCRIENCPTSPRITKVGPCSICKICQNQFDKGRDPSKRYKTKSK